MTEGRAIDWEARYHDGATAWERPGLHPSFVDWLETGALAPCRILVPGGGRSSEPLALAEAGFDVTVVDLAESAVAAQRARLERLQVAARVELANLLTWDAPAPFDAIYDQACLCALPPATWPGYVQRLHRWLRPGGRLFALFMQTGSAGGPPFDCGLPAMRSLFPDPPWQWPATLGNPVPHPSGRIEQPVILYARS
ncbi:MAG: methyltransferase domain-containing protein [Acetobacteraceae bacterium]|nr:methyltransferase domain-containing protein [Acetobacteraceae bacterium]